MKKATATLVVTGLCTAYILWKIDVRHTVHVLVNGHPGWFFVSIGIMMLSVWPMAWRWQHLLGARGVHDSLGRLVRTYFVGYAAGHTKNPTYRQVCSGTTDHAEVVLVVFDPKKVRYEDLLKVFWENHDPTQGMRQGNDVGTQYRSGIYYTSDEQSKAAEASRDMYQKQLSASGYPKITTEILPAPEFYYAEDYHQQYLAKNPDGYCGLGGTGVTCPVGVGATTA